MAAKKRKKQLVVSFTYDLPVEYKFHEEFKELLHAFEWESEIKGIELPNTTCIKFFDDEKTEKAAAEAAMADIVELVLLIREKTSLKDFKIGNFYLLAHSSPDALPIYGTAFDPEVDSD